MYVFLLSYLTPTLVSASMSPSAIGLDIFVWLGVAASLYVVVGRITRQKVTNATLPPGPKGWPLIGNLLEVPSAEPWKVYAEWGEKWGGFFTIDFKAALAHRRGYSSVSPGGIMSVDVLGQRMIVVNSVEIATDLLEGRSSNYSDRPILTMGGEIVGWNGALALTNYGPRFKELRRLLASAIGSIRNVERYYPLEELETRKFLARVTARPGELPQQIRK